jgi:acyl-CoA reductase-like NAD-dependent aldehyde dehydrogenase
MTDPRRIYVGGEWRASLSGGTYEKRDPWRPDVVTGTYAAANAADAAAAVEAAREALPT